MTDVSDQAADLLQTLKRIPKIKTSGGMFIDKRRVLIDYGYSQDSKALDNLFKELKDEEYIKFENGAYRLLAKALNQKSSSSHSVNVFSGNFHQSNIANMSSHIQQVLDLSSYSTEIQKEVVELQEAIAEKDDTRAKRIIDGLLVSAPQLVMSAIQLGLSMHTGTVA